MGKLSNKHDLNNSNLYDITGTLMIKHVFKSFYCV